MSPRKQSATQHSTLNTQHFSWPVRVYHEDTDSGGVVYHANYLRFLERARTEWLRARGFEQPALAREHGVVFVVTSLFIDYRKPARFNDELEVTVEPVQFGASLIVLSQRIVREAQELVSARVKVACVNTMSFKPVRIPSSVSDSLVRHAAKRKIT
ncbi:MAG: tol-pal system-associated acyl-CoA thioesterase [Betaproteobacteria bacterium]|nr:tol-pal system-associated acyl-CoA thioesterase [Betaproteobacteria bacterium]